MNMKPLFFFLTVAALLSSGFAVEESIRVELVKGPRNEADISGFFTAPVSRKAAWRVLSDYDGIAGYVSSMRSSRVTRRAGDRIVVEQVGHFHVMMFSQSFTVVLELRESPQERIDFKDLDGKTFRTYEGNWGLAEENGTVTVTYHLSALLNSDLATSLAGGMMKNAVKELLGEVRSEMIRRAKSEDR